MKFDIQKDTEKHIKAIEASLRKLEKEARTNDTLFHYQTLLYKFRARLIDYNTSI